MEKYPDVGTEKAPDLAEIAFRQQLLADNFITGLAPYSAEKEWRGITLRPHQSPAL